MTSRFLGRACGWLVSCTALSLSGTSAGSVAAQTSDLAAAYDSAFAERRAEEALALNRLLVDSVEYAGVEWQRLALDRAAILLHLQDYEATVAVAESVLAVAHNDSVKNYAADHVLHALTELDVLQALEYVVTRYEAATSCRYRTVWQADLAYVLQMAGLHLQALREGESALASPCADSLGDHRYHALYAVAAGHANVGSGDTALAYILQALQSNPAPAQMLDVLSLMLDVAGCPAAEFWHRERDRLRAWVDDAGDPWLSYKFALSEIEALGVYQSCDPSSAISVDSFLSIVDAAEAEAEAIELPPSNLYVFAVVKATTLAIEGNAKEAVAELLDALSSLSGLSDVASREANVEILLMLSQLEAFANPPVALEYASRAIDGAEQLDNRLLHVRGLIVRGMILQANDRSADARQDLEEAERSIQRIGIENFLASAIASGAGYSTSPAKLWLDLNTWLGAALVKQGDYRAAESRLERALGIAESLGDSTQLRTILLTLSLSRQSQGDSASAIAYSNLAETLGVAGGVLPSDRWFVVVAETLTGLASGDSATRQAAFAASDSLLANEGLALRQLAVVREARVRVLQAKYIATHDSTDRAALEDELRAYLTFSQSMGRPFGMWFSYLGLGYAAMGEAKDEPQRSAEALATASRHFRAAAREAERASLGQELVQALTPLAAVEIARDSMAAADSVLEVLFEAAERVRFQLVRDESLRTQFSEQIHFRDAYGIAVLFYSYYGGEIGVWKSLRVAELAKARGLSDLFIQRATMSLGPRVAADQVNVASLGWADVASRVRVVSQLAEQERGISTQAALVDSQYVRLFEESLERTLSFESLEELTNRRGTGILSFFFYRQWLAVWYIGDGSVWNAAIPVDTLQFGTLIDRARARESDRFGRRSQSATRQARALRELFELLVGPLSEPFAQTKAKNLVIVPHGILSLVPFAALPAGDGSDRVLADRFSLVVLPALHLLGYGDTRERGADRGKAKSFLGVIDPTGTLPAAPQEVNSAARYFAPAFVLAESAATEEELYKAWGESQVLHFATHAVAIDRFPNESYILLAPGATSDGRLSVAEVLGVTDLPAELVVLSACESGGGQVLTGEGIMGFARAFLAAGAGAVLVTLWPVRDTVARDFMAEFYASWRAGPRTIPEAYVVAIRKTREKYPDYSDWAAFELVANRW